MRNLQAHYLSGLKKVAEGLSDILKGNFVGFYIMGSFVMGDWDPGTSDIDFIAVTKKPLTRQESVSIARMHNALSSTDLGKKLDGAYAYLEQLQQKRQRSSLSLCAREYAAANEVTDVFSIF